MNEKERTRFSPPAIGGSSLLVVFAVLCLTVFALLSLSTVRADERLGDASAQAVSDYYAADLAAEEILARLRAGETPEDVGFDLDVCSYACPISDSQVLAVEVRLDLDSYTILRWQVIPVGDWQPDETLDLWDGELF